MDSDDLEFVMMAADALNMSDEEYGQLFGELTAELEQDEEWDDEFYDLAGPWDDWLEPDEWYELSAEYEEH